MEAPQGQSHGPSDKLDSIPNFRDVARLVNPKSPSQIRPNLLYRSARPDEATPTDRVHLSQTLGIKSIIDLRSKTEHLEQARKHAALNPPPTNPATAPSNDRAASPFKIPGLRYHEISFNGTAFSMGLMRQLKYTSSAKLIYLMAIGSRLQGISILSKEVMAPRGLVGLAIDSLHYSTYEVYAVFKVLADETAYPILVHCTQGKDRTGLTVLLVLMLLGVEREAIKEDYLRSQTDLMAERQEKVDELRSIGLPDDFADCPEDWVDKVVDHIEAHYGGVEKYLLRCSVTKEMQDAVRRKLRG